MSTKWKSKIHEDLEKRCINKQTDKDCLSHHLKQRWIGKTDEQDRQLKKKDGKCGSREWRKLGNCTDGEVDVLKEN